MLLRNFIWLLFFAFSAHSSYEQPDFQILNWTVNEGLSQGSVHKMLRDSMGFLWIATDNGLDRFDGTIFRQYIHGQGVASRGFRGSEVLGIVEDSLHNLWIGSEEGLNRYVNRADSFQHFATPRTNNHMTSYSLPLLAGKEDVVCWEITGTIVSYNIHSLKRRILFEDMSWPGVSYSLLNNLAYENTSATVWAPYENKILCLRLKDLKQETIALPADAGTCQSVLVTGSMLLVATSKGLLQYNTAEKKFGKVEWATGFSFARVLSLAKNKDGLIWVGVQDEGLYLYNPVSSRLYNYRNKKSGINSLSANNVYHLYCDEKGFTWASVGNRAIDQIFPFEQPIEFFNKKTSNTNGSYSVRCFEEDAQKKIWIGTQGGGINIFNPVTKEFTRFPISRIKSDSIQSLKFNNRKSKLWIATNSEVVQMNAITKKSFSIHFVDEFESKIDLPVIIHQLVSFNDSMWLVATSHGVFVLSENSHIARRIKGMAENVFFIGKYGNKFSFSLWDFDPVMYSYREGQWKKENFPFDDITVGCIFYDERRKVFWVGTDRGLLMTDTAFKRLKHFTVADGLPDNFIWGLLIDSFGNIWMTTNKGVACYNINKDQIRNFAPSDGIHGLEYNAYAYLQASDKTIYLGGKEGFDHIKPSLLDYGLSSADVYFSSFKVNNQQYIKETTANFISDLLLTKAQNNFVISAGAIDFFTPGRALLRYKLFPAEKEWQEVRAPYDIRYSGLSPGNYTLYVTASEAGRNWNGNVKKIKIIILPPLWQRGWFLTLSGVIILAIIFFMAQKRINQVRKREKEKSETVKRMAELELQSLRAQLNPHFMFNSLNAIQELILLEESEKSQSYLARFSKLLRMLLENAERPFIPLQREIDFLQLYLSLENLRVPDLQHSISVDPAIYTEQTLIPNMILQPYIENAIWHGLSHKQSDRRLKIRIGPENGFIKYEIEDNGVGRKKSAELKSLFRKEHKSKGMELLSKRFKLLAKEYGSDIETTVDDVMNNEEVAGTLVTIKVPDEITIKK